MLYLYREVLLASLYNTILVSRLMDKDRMTSSANSISPNAAIVDNWNVLLYKNRVTDTREYSGKNVLYLYNYI